METVSDLASKCIRCGFCLESCPTFQLTGEETESPRGRIYLIRTADAGLVAWKDAKPHLDRCLGCRACETACPSGVHYGKLLEMARERLGTPPAQSVLLGMLTRPALLRLGTRFSKRVPWWFARWLGGPGASLPPQPPLPKGEGEIPHPPAPSPLSLRSDKEGEPETPPPSPLPATRAIGGEGEKIVLLEGCAMRVMFPGVHRATRQLLAAAGYRVMFTDLGCCGALEAHSGRLAEGIRKAECVRTKANGTPIVVNSAGCGGWLKEQGIDAKDICEVLVDLKPLLAKSTLKAKVTYHDACHLAHGQKIREQPRQLIEAIPGVELIEMREADRCCGSAGIYNLTQPELARRLQGDKWASIEATGAEYVVMGNPGCQAWLMQAAQESSSSIKVVHLAELLAMALDAS